ncbi:hypothetical protein L1887_43445 [Cichorium endivia]|nr:hypothetical protein L1887_43445 [Cichorium endivia]
MAIVAMPSLSNNKSIIPKRPQMGKIKSWSAGLGAKLSGNSGDKQDIASEVEQRKKGIDSLYTSTEAYWSYLGKKKPVPFDTSPLPVDDTASVASNAVANKPEGKMLPVEALGLAMASFGAVFPEGSPYGACLGLLGEAHAKLGFLQTTFTKDTSHIFLARIARSKATLDSFTAALKKLDSATARLESAQSKVQKSKKEKRELEEELRLAKAAYDEAVTDVEARGEAIQDAEYDDWQCLTTYMQAQLDYIGQAHAVMEQVKAMWADAPAPSRSGASTPLTRPRSMSGPKLRPTISRRSSAKDAVDISTSSSRFASRSSLSLAGSDRPSSATDDSKRDKDKEQDKDKDKEKKNRLRMPSFSGAGDTVASVASGIGSFGRAKGSTLFSSNGEASGSDKEREPSKWNFMARSKKEPGFVSMDHADKTQTNGDDNHAGRPPALPARDYVRPSVSAHDVHLGHHDGTAANGHGTASPDLRLSRADSDDEDYARDHDASPFSPDADAMDFLDVQRNRSTHDTIHERGESQLSAEVHMMDSTFLGPSGALQPHSLSLNHTGLSAFSDGADPFGGSAMSPQQTGGRFDESEASTDDEEERQGLTSGSLIDSTGARRPGMQPSSSWVSFKGASSTANGPTNGLSGSPSQRGPPPPIPPSSSFLSRSKAKLAPPPPPLPTRNSS